MCYSSYLRRAAGVLAALVLVDPACAGLSLDEALRLAREQAPAVRAQQHALAGAQAAQPAAAALPDPRLSLGVDNLPLNGVDRYSLTRDFMTMQRIGVMQELPNRARREARSASAQARVERERALLAAGQLAAQREAALAWLGLYFAQARAAPLAELEREVRLAIDTLDARIAAGRSVPAEHSAAGLDALALADRRDAAQRDIDKARAALRRWVGARADEPLDGEPHALALPPAGWRDELPRHAEIAPFVALRAMAQAEAAEAQAEQGGDWAWELAYSRRGPQFSDMLSFQVRIDLPWWREQRQLPLLAAKQREVQRIEAERDGALQRYREEIDAQLAELQALDAQHQRLQSSGLPLAAQRVALALASYQAGRSELGAVLMARRDAVEARLRLIDLQAQRMALRVRLGHLFAE